MSEKVLHEWTSGDAGYQSRVVRRDDGGLIWEKLYSSGWSTNSMTTPPLREILRLRALLAEVAECGGIMDGPDECPWRICMTVDLWDQIRALRGGESDGD